MRKSKLTLLYLMIFVLCVAVPAAFATSFYPFSGGLISGGTGDLDSRDNPTDKDAAFVILNDDGTYGNAAFFFSFDDNASAGESPPLVVAPDTGSGEWELVDGHFADIKVWGGNINTGAVGLTIGDGATTSMTFSTDGSGNAEFTFPADVIGDADIDWGTGSGQVSCADIGTTDCGALSVNGNISLGSGGDDTFQIASTGIDIDTSGNITNAGTIGSGAITSTGTVEGATLTEGGQAVYNATETPGGELEGTWATPTIDNTGITLTSITIGSLLGVDSIDATGAVDMDIGSTDVTDITFLSDGDFVFTPPADTDITLTFTGTTASGSLKWMEDEDYFLVGDDVHNTNEVTGGVYTVTVTGSCTFGTDCDSTSVRGVYGGVVYTTSAATITLPAVAAGMSVTVITIGATAVTIDCNASNYITLNGTDLSQGDSIDNTSTTGDMAVCTYYKANYWYCAAMSPDGDPWVDGDP